MPRVYVTPNLDNACETCWERVNTLLRAQGMPPLDDLAWCAGQWIETALVEAGDCPHTAPDIGGVFLERDMPEEP